jgi:hypothetical protein
MIRTYADPVRLLPFPYTKSLLLTIQAEYESFLCEKRQRYLVLIKTYLYKIISETGKIIKTVPCKQEIPPNRNPPRPAHLLEPRTKYGMYLKVGCQPHPSGSKSFVHIPDTQRRKLDPKSLRCFLIGYCDLQKGYRFWDPKSPIV